MVRRLCGGGCFAVFRGVFCGKKRGKLFIFRHCACIYRKKAVTLRAEHINKYAHMKEYNLKTVIKVCSWDELTLPQQELIAAAKGMTDNSYCPYSRFRVGAAARLEGGVVVKGSNQENAAYPSGLCAERTTLFAANANYPDKAVESLAIACRKPDGFTAKPGAPCGACRQVMIETEHRFGRPMEVLLYGADEIYVVESAEALLPLGFFAEDLPAS